MPLYINKQSTNSHQTNVSYSPLNRNFQALQQLKEAERQVDLMKRRISALKVKEQKNISQTQIALKKLKYHKIIQQLENKRKMENESYRNQVHSRIQRQRELNSSERSIRRKKVIEAKEVMQQMRSNSFVAQKRASKQINQRLKQLNNQQYMSRREIRDNVRKSQKISQKNYDIFCQQRKSSIRYYRDQQQSRVIDLKQKRQYEMRELARMEIQLLERQSRSKQNAQKSINQLVSHYKISNKRLASTQLSHSQSVNPQTDLS